MAERFVIKLSNPNGELESELVAFQAEPRTLAEVLQLCGSYRANARLSDATGKPRGEIDPEGGFSPTRRNQRGPRRKDSTPPGAQPAPVGPRC